MVMAKARRKGSQRERNLAGVCRMIAISTASSPRNRALYTIQKNFQRKRKIRPSMSTRAMSAFRHVILRTTLSGMLLSPGRLMNAGETASPGDAARPPHYTTKWTRGYYRPPLFEPPLFEPPPFEPAPLEPPPFTPPLFEPPPFEPAPLEPPPFTPPLFEPPPFEPLFEPAPFAPLFEPAP